MSKNTLDPKKVLSKKCFIVILTNSSKMEDPEFFGKVSELIASGGSFVIATVISAEGSTLAKPGFKLLMTSDNEVVAGSLGGGCPESAIIPTASEAIRTGVPRLLKVHLEQSEKALEAMLKPAEGNEVYVETFCGGNLSVFVEPYTPKKRVVLFGQGGRDSVEDALLDLLRWSGFNTVLISPSPDSPERADSILDSINEDPELFEFRPSDAAIVLTKGNEDIRILELLSRRDLHYVGLLASRKRSQKDREDLKQKGVSEDFLNTIHTPIGIDINAISPREIAMSIVSELIMSHNVGRRSKDRKAEPEKAL